VQLGGEWVGKLGYKKRTHRKIAILGAKMKGEHENTKTDRFEKKQCGEKQGGGQVFSGTDPVKRQDSTTRLPVFGLQKKPWFNARKLGKGKGRRKELPANGGHSTEKKGREVAGWGPQSTL